MTVALVGVVLVGSWFVVSAPTSSTALPATRHVGETSLGVGSAATGVTPPVTIPPSSESTSPIVVPEVSTVLVPSALPAVPSSTITPVPTLPSVAPPLRAPVEGGKATSAFSPVASSLIAEVDQESHGKDVIPATADNVDLLGRWMANEGGLWADNPLNTSAGAAAYPHQHSVTGHDTGIPIYPSMSTGIQTAASTLLSNRAYARILRVLGSGKASCLKFATAVIRSPWASSHYGHDPSGFCSGRIVPVRRHHGRHRAK